ncbi:MAG: nitroreductase family protein, partial [Sphaerochaetaceae bacterium]|nr:nitroreductase family protein [Sphaerochaetaceae bacterium]
MEFFETVKQRYACKSYDGRPVPTDILNKILEAGRLAPTAKNLQEQRIYVLQSEESKAKMDSLTP